MPVAAAGAGAKPHRHTGPDAKPGRHSLAATKSKLYNPRHPERTVLHRTVAGRLETWLAPSSAGQFGGQFDGQGEHHTPPALVEQALRKYLESAIFAHGFARVRCEHYAHDYFVAFVCKGRALCPACNARRKAQTRSGWAGGAQ